MGRCYRRRIGCDVGGCLCWPVEDVMPHNGRESEDDFGQNKSTTRPSEVDLYKQALVTIRQAGHNYDPVVRWMQQIAASVLSPGVFPLPTAGPPEFDPQYALQEAVVFHLWRNYQCALSEARSVVAGNAAEEIIKTVLDEVCARIAASDGLSRNTNVNDLEV